MAAAVGKSWDVGANIECAIEQPDHSIQHKPQISAVGCAVSTVEIPTQKSPHANKFASSAVGTRQCPVPTSVYKVGTRQCRVPTLYVKFCKLCSDFYAKSQMPTEREIEGYAAGCDRSPPRPHQPMSIGELAKLLSLHRWLETIFLSTLGTRDGY